MLAGAGAACAAALAGCARYNANNGGIAGRPARPEQPAATGRAGSGPARDRRPERPAVLASTSDIPVGGGKILTDKKIVITQPQAGYVRRVHRGVHPSGLHRRHRVGRHHQLPVPRQQVQHRQRLGRQRPGHVPLAPVSIKVQGTSIIQA